VASLHIPPQYFFRRIIMSFQQLGLHLDLLKAIRRLGYHEPTPIQKQAIPLALAGRDLIGCAQTGTGKTAAFSLPILNKLHPVRSGKIRALILTPTRELAAQINEVAQGLAANTRLYTAAIYGGVGFPPQEHALKLGTDIIVATPGRLLDLMNKGIGRFDGLEFLILDEADRMLDMGFLPEVRRIISYLPQKRQTMMFSATMPREIFQLSKQILHNPATIQIGRQSAPAEGVNQSAYPVAQNLKPGLLLALLKTTEMASVLIFTRTKVRADRLARQLKHGGFEAACIHGDRTQGQRREALKGFRTRRYRILVATDIAARGIDVDGISHVINFDVPVSPGDYVHRIGRTARAKAVGEALTLIAPAEESFLAAIQRLTKTKIPRKTVPDFDYSKVFTPRPESRGQQGRGFGGNGFPARQNGRNKARRRKRARPSFY
jgi:ATP-dependent RNA helicase RhlE